MIEKCPICNRVLKKIVSKINNEQKIFLNCYPSEDSHHYSVDSDGDKIIEMRVRLAHPSIDYICFCSNYANNDSYIWQFGKRYNAFKINAAFVPDFTDIDKLIQKISTYLILS